MQDEIKETIKSMPPDKAPGPDGFTGAFFKACWDIINDDVTATVNSLYMLNSQGFELLNTANITLLPKEKGRLSSYRYLPNQSHS